MMPAAQAAWDNAQMVAGITSWTICSVGMMVFNKLAIKAFPLECTLVTMQMLCTVVAMLIFQYRQIRIGSVRDVLRWSIVIPFFVGMLLTSILALKTAPMTLVVTLRVLSPLVSLGIERFYPNPLHVSPAMVVSIFGMFLGTSMYVSKMDKNNWNGIVWVFLNIIFAVGDRLFQRLMLAKDQYPVDVSIPGLTLLNNFLGVLPLSIAVWWTDELHKTPATVASMNALGAVWVVASCIVGVGISYCGIWAQSLISATSFMVLVNVNKFAIILLEVFVMRTKKTHPLQVAGAIIAILAGVAYGRAREAIQKQCPEQKFEKSKDPEETMRLLESHKKP